MGGRGGSSGISASGKPYGSEYHTVYRSGNIKFVKSNDGSSSAPPETMTMGRVYVTADKNTDKLKYISCYNKQNKRSKQINIKGIHEQPHTHKGYTHNEKGDRKPAERERKMIDGVLKTRYNKQCRQSYSKEYAVMEVTVQIRTPAKGIQKYPFLMKFGKKKGEVIPHPNTF